MSSTSSAKPRARASEIRRPQVSIASTYLSGLTSCEPAWKEKPDDPDAALGRVLDQPDRGVGVAAELARQVDDRVGIAEGDAQQQADPRAAGVELRDLLGVVDDEGRDAAVERVADVGAALDRVGVDAARSPGCRRRGRGPPRHSSRGRTRRPRARAPGRRSGRARASARSAGRRRAVPSRARGTGAAELAVDHEQRRAELDGERLEGVGCIGRRKAQVRLQSGFSLNRAEDRPESAGDQVRRGSHRARPCRPRP